jgi:hypothetical protein
MHTTRGDGDSSGHQQLIRLLVSETREEMLKADHKAGLALSALCAALVALLGVASGEASPESYGLAAQTLFWAGCAAWVPALIALVLAVAPRTGRPQRARAHYFGDIALTGSVLRLGTIVRDTELMDRELSQLTVLSRVVSSKYRCIRYGMFWSIPFFVLAPLGVLTGAQG